MINRPSFDSAAQTFPSRSHATAREAEPSNVLLFRPRAPAHRRGEAKTVGLMGLIGGVAVLNLIIWAAAGEAALHAIV